MTNPFQWERLPTVGELIEVIRTMPYHVERCRQMGPHGSHYINEVFIDVLGVWVDFNGKRYSADRGRGYAYPRGFAAWRLRRAIRRWRRMTNA